MSEVFFEKCLWGLYTPSSGPPLGRSPGISLATPAQRCDGGSRQRRIAWGETHQLTKSGSTKTVHQLSLFINQP